MPAGSGPHDVAPARDGTVWYTAQAAGKLGRLDPATGKVTEVPLGDGSAPHGVIVGPDGAPWVTDGGLNAIVRVDPGTLAVKRYPLPASSGYANLNTATFDRRGAALVHRPERDLRPPRSAQRRAARVPRPGRSRAVRDRDDARRPGLVRVARRQPRRADQPRHRQGDGPPAADAGQGARRIWSDSHGRLWVSEWNAGRVARYDPQTPPLARVATAGRGPAVRGLRRRPRHRLADRLRRRRDRALRPEDAALHALPPACRTRTCGSCSDGPARSGAPSRERTGSCPMSR